MDLFDIYFTMSPGDIHGFCENRIQGVWVRLLTFRESNLVAILKQHFKASHINKSAFPFIGVAHSTAYTKTWNVIVSWLLVLSAGQAATGSRPQGHDMVEQSLIYLLCKWDLLTVTGCKDTVHTLRGSSELRIVRLCSLKWTAPSKHTHQFRSVNQTVRTLISCFISRDFDYLRDNCISWDYVLYFFGPRVHETEPSTS